MTGTELAYTEAATARLDDYLRQVRAALAGVPGVSPLEVEADVREHVDAELRHAPRPAQLAALEAVLAALGPPAQWRPAGSRGAGFDLRAARDWLAEVGRTLYRGREDWRLAYLCLILVVLAPLTAGITLVVAYLLGRAAAELARERGEPLGARRWLVYPALVAVSLPLLLGVTLAPLGVAPLVYGGLVLPAETYRDAVASVDPDGTVHFRPGFDASSRYRMSDAGFQKWAPDSRGRPVWTVREPDRTLHPRTLAVMARMPVPSYLAGAALAAFATLGVALGWWLVCGLTRRAFPRTTATVLFPLLDPEPRGGPWVTVGCAIALAGWLGAAWALAA